MKKKAKPVFFSYKKQLNGIIIAVVSVCVLLSTITVQAALGGNEQIHHHPSWKQYPYEPPGTEIVFPDDEGSHNGEYTVEWWYANFLLTGQDTGNQYGAFIAFYLIQSGFAENLEIRFLSISDIANEFTYTNAKIGTLSASTDYFDLCFTPLFGNQVLDTDIYQQGSPQNLGDGGQQQFIAINEDHSFVHQQPVPPDNQDTWKTKIDENDELLPFQYELDIRGKAQQDDHQPMRLIMDMDCDKKPLIVAGDGHVVLDDDPDGAFSYYYSLTKVNTSGSLTVRGITEPVSGKAWIDHQWGNFSDTTHQSIGLVVTYEWFSIKLENYQEIMVGDIWDRATGEKIDQSFSDGLNLVDSEGTLELIEDYTITQLEYWTDPMIGNTYASQWQISANSPSTSLNLIITPLYPDQMMRVLENWPLIQKKLSQYLAATGFWEGICTVEGDFNGQPISGNAYVELTHYYNDDEPLR